jgi:prepilin-type N-terminal cleavage/methylation domain-containing protein
VRRDGSTRLAATRAVESGFTLLELLVAIVLTGVVALLVYGAAGVAVDTQQRLEAKGREVRARQAWRTMLQEAFRNTRPAATYADTAFYLEERFVGGRPADRVTFVTAGSMPPLTADSDWIVTLEATGEGLVLSARPVGAVVPGRRIVGIPGVTGLDVRVLDRQFGAEDWSETWEYARFVPAAVELTYWTEEGPMAPSERLWLPLGGVQW